MNEETPPLRKSLRDDLDTISNMIHVTAQTHQHSCLELLALLRLLEELHRDIRDTLFQKALPDNRQALYGLLRDIEVNGGWPYINRIRLRTLLDNLSFNELLEDSSCLGDSQTAATDSALKD